MKWKMRIEDLWPINNFEKWLTEEIKKEESSAAAKPLAILLLSRYVSDFSEKDKKIRCVSNQTSFPFLVLLALERDSVQLTISGPWIWYAAQISFLASQTSL